MNIIISARKIYNASKGLSGSALFNNKPAGLVRRKENRMTKLTEEQEKQLVADYTAKNRSTKEIASEYGVSRSAVSTIVKRRGGELRRPKGKAVKCCNCYRKIDVLGAKFCPYCGADIRTEKDLIKEKINKLFSLLNLLPENQRDPAQSIVKEIINYIDNEG